MNHNTVISLPVAADLSGQEGSLVKITSTSVNLCTALTDRFIGTLERGNVTKQDGGSAVGMAADIFLAGFTGIHFVKCGNNTAITAGDELEQDSTDGRIVKRVAGTFAGVAVDSVPANSDGGLFRALLAGSAQQSAFGLPVDITQITSKATGVIASGSSGQITTHGAALAAAAEVTFTVTNTLVGARDVPVLALASGGTSGAYLLTVDAVAAGSYDITISNASAGSLSEALVINYVINKGAAA